MTVLSDHEKNVASLLLVPASKDLFDELLKELVCLGNVTASPAQQLLPFVFQKLVSFEEGSTAHVADWQRWMSDHFTTLTLFKALAFLLAQPKDRHDAWLAWAWALLGQRVRSPAFLIDFWHSEQGALGAEEGRPLMNWQQWALAFLFGLPWKLANRHAGVHCFLGEKDVAAVERVFFKCIQRSAFYFVRHMLLVKAAGAWTWKGTDEEQAMVLLLAKLCRLGKSASVAIILYKLIEHRGDGENAQDVAASVVGLIAACSPMYQKSILSSLFLFMSQQALSFSGLSEQYGMLLDEALSLHPPLMKLEELVACSLSFHSTEAKLAWMSSLLTHCSRGPSRNMLHLDQLWCSVVKDWKAALESSALSSDAMPFLIGTFQPMSWYVIFYSFLSFWWCICRSFGSSVVRAPLCREICFACCFELRPDS